MGIDAKPIKNRDHPPEGYKITRKEKLLGSFLSTTKDIKQRKILIMFAMKKLDYSWKGRSFKETRKTKATLSMQEYEKQVTREKEGDMK